jgi:hypothetical protein
VAATFLGKEEGRRAPGEDEERWSVGRGEDEEEHFFPFLFDIFCKPCGDWVILARFFERVRRAHVGAEANRSGARGGSHARMG